MPTLLTLLLLSLMSIPTGGQQSNLARPIQFLNQSGRNIELYWIHPLTREQVLQSNPLIHNGASFSLNSYIGHEFEIRETPTKGSNYCADRECNVSFVNVTGAEDQVIIIEKGVNVKRIDDHVLAKKSAESIIQYCRREGQKLHLNNTSMLLDFIDNCNEELFTDRLVDASKEIKFQANVRKHLAIQWEEYTCADDDAPLPEPVEKSRWHGLSVSKYLDRDSAKIHIIENFINTEECEAVMEAAKPLLHKATVADGSGGSQYSKSRNAMQAGVRVPWEEEVNGHAIPSLAKRIYAYTNRVTNLNLSPSGQEDLMAIQYDGKNYEDGHPPDRYTPHCDGECTGLPHKPGTRVATMVMYCEAPGE